MNLPGPRILPDAHLLPCKVTAPAPWARMGRGCSLPYGALKADGVGNGLLVPICDCPEQGCGWPCYLLESHVESCPKNASRSPSAE